MEACFVKAEYRLCICIGQLEFTIIVSHSLTFELITIMLIVKLILLLRYA